MINSCLKPMEKLFDLETWVALALALGSLLGAFFSPISPFIGVAFFLVAADYGTGIRAAKKRGEAITSSGHYRCIEKFVMYSLAIVMSEIVKNVFLPVVPLTYFIALLIVRTEFRSNIENIESITGTKIWAAITEKFPILKK